jgi:RND family efflux transporter MFP subunit
MKHLISALIAVIFYACSISQAGDAEEANTARLSHIEPVATEVGTVPVQKGAFELELISNGKLEAQRRAVVPFAVQEQIIDVSVREGQSIAAGQTLGKVEPFTFQKRLSDAENAYQQALIDLEDRLLGHGYALSDTASVPPNILEMALIRSNYNNAVSALAEARRNLSQTTIAAPISGVIANLNAKEHNHSSSYQNFCEILDINSMHLVFNVLETEMPLVKVGQKVELFPFALSGKSFPGTVSSINPAVDDKGMVRITASVPNPNQHLMYGMNARVLLKNAVPDCLVIPKEAVLYRQNRKVVFVYEEGKAIWKYVETSHENSTHVAVTDGLEEGMEVIVENNLNLAHESLVTVINEQ